jgi:hypothetical protein
VFLNEIVNGEIHHAKITHATAPNTPAAIATGITSNPPRTKTRASVALVFPAKYPPMKIKVTHPKVAI